MFWGHCDHNQDRIRCIHGDEINQRGGKRSICMDCGATWDGLPERCYFTVGFHGHSDSAIAATP